VALVYAGNNQANFCDNPSCASSTAEEEEEEVMSYETLEAHLEQHDTLNFWDNVAKFAESHPRLAKAAIKLTDRFLKKIKIKGVVMWKEKVPQSAIVDMGDRCVSSCEWMATQVGRETTHVFKNCDKRYIVFIKQNRNETCPTKSQVSSALIQDLARKCKSVYFGGCKNSLQAGLSDATPPEGGNDSTPARTLGQDKTVIAAITRVVGAMAECYTRQEPQITTPENLNLGKVCTWTGPLGITADVPLKDPSKYQVGQKCPYQASTVGLVRRWYKFTNKKKM
jgi:hypothetical protein